jgi:hypothetical protein
MQVVLMAFALVMYYVAVSRRLSESKADAYIREVFPTADEAQ